jgi:SAM-dependent methyltransferase
VQKNFYSEYYEVEDKHWWFIGRRRIILRLLSRYFARDNEKTRSLLDIGCGTGTMLSYLSKFGSAQGVDADEAAVSFCQLRGLQNVQQFDGRKLPFSDGTFDLVTMFDVLEHIEDDRSALKEVFRVLKARGLFMFTVPAYQFLWGAQDIVSHHKRRYLLSDLRSRIRASGFELLRISYFNSILFPWIAAIRIGRRIREFFGAEPAPLKSDFTVGRSRSLNSFLSGVFSLEQFVVPHVNLPVGVSIIGVATRRLD